MKTDYTAVKKHMKGNAGNSQTGPHLPSLTINGFENNFVNAASACDLQEVWMKKIIIATQLDIDVVVQFTLVPCVKPHMCVSISTIKNHHLCDCWWPRRNMLVRSLKPFHWCESLFFTQLVL